MVFGQNLQSRGKRTRIFPPSPFGFFLGSGGGGGGWATNGFGQDWGERGKRTKEGQVAEWGRAKKKEDKTNSSFLCFLCVLAFSKKRGRWGKNSQAKNESDILRAVRNATRLLFLRFRPPPSPLRRERNNKWGQGGGRGQD